MLSPHPVMGYMGLKMCIFEFIYELTEEISNKSVIYMYKIKIFLVIHYFLKFQEKNVQHGI